MKVSQLSLYFQGLLASNEWNCFYRFGMIQGYVSSSRCPAILQTVLPLRPLHNLLLSSHPLLLQEMTLGDVVFQRHPILLQVPICMKHHQYILK